MGSSVKRKENDRRLINLPLKKSSNSDTEGGGVNSSAPVDINNICPVAIRQRLMHGGLAEGTALVLDGSSIRLASDSSVEVGKLTTSQTKTVTKCSGLGIEYHNIYVVIDKKGIRYAEIAQQ